MDNSIIDPPFAWIKTDAVFSASSPHANMKPDYAVLIKGQSGRGCNQEAEPTASSSQKLLISIFFITSVNNKTIFFEKWACSLFANIKGEWLLPQSAIRGRPRGFVSL